MRNNDKLELDIYSSWIDQSGMGLLVVDDTLTVVMVNRELCLMLGLLATDVLDKPMGNVLRQFRDAQALQHWIGKGLYGERDAQRQTATDYKHFKLKCSAVHAVGGQAFKVVSVLDTTELMRLKHGSKAESAQAWDGALASTEA